MTTSTQTDSTETAGSQATAITAGDDLFVVTGAPGGDRTILFMTTARDILTTDTGLLLVAEVDLTFRQRPDEEFVAQSGDRELFAYALESPSITALRTTAAEARRAAQDERRARNQRIEKAASDARAADDKLRIAKSALRRVEGSIDLRNQEVARTTRERNRWEEAVTAAIRAVDNFDADRLAATQRVARAQQAFDESR